ncbi:MAG: hypothetical protein K5848_04815 [Lachnospiraceae bacterium]|nr:hypothetical protein [Lachnospiraceae bacterium]
MKKRILSVIVILLAFCGCSSNESKSQNTEEKDLPSIMIDADDTNASATNKDIKVDESDNGKCVINQGEYDHYTVGILSEKENNQVLRCIENNNIYRRELYIVDIVVPEEINLGEVVVLYYDGKIEWQYDDADSSGNEALAGTVSEYEIHPLEGNVLNAVILNLVNTYDENHSEAATCEDGGPANSYLMSLEERGSGQTSFIEAYIECADLSESDELPFIGDEVEIEFDRDTLDIVRIRKKQ